MQRQIHQQQQVTCIKHTFYFYFYFYFLLRLQGKMSRQMENGKDELASSQNEIWNTKNVKNKAQKHNNTTRKTYTIIIDEWSCVYLLGVMTLLSGEGQTFLERTQIIRDAVLCVFLWGSSEWMRSLPKSTIHCMILHTLSIKYTLYCLKYILFWKRTKYKVPWK
jgi:hypothetical protein